MYRIQSDTPSPDFAVEYNNHGNYLSDNDFDEIKINTEETNVFAIISPYRDYDGDRHNGYTISFYYYVFSKEVCFDWYKWLVKNVMGVVEKEDFRIHYTNRPNDTVMSIKLCDFVVNHHLGDERGLYADTEKLNRDKIKRDKTNNSTQFHANWIHGLAKDVDNDLENLKPCLSTTSFVALCDESLSIMILLFILFSHIVNFIIYIIYIKSFSFLSKNKRSQVFLASFCFLLADMYSGTRSIPWPMCLMALCFH